MMLQGKKVIVIGGSSGIGKATAAAAVREGAAVVIAGRTPERLDRAVAEIGGNVSCRVLDVRDQRGMDYFLEQEGPFDHLVFTAAEVHPVSFLEVHLEEVRRMFEVKFWGQFVAAQEAAGCIRPGGSMTLFSGLAARKPERGLTVLAAINGAVEALVRALAIELSPIRVNAVAPGYVETAEMSAEQRARLAASLPARRLATPEDIAAAVLFLMTNPYATGTVLALDGGNHII